VAAFRAEQAGSRWRVLACFDPSWPNLILRVACFDQRGPKLGAHTDTMMTEWIEHLRCPRCGKTGDAQLYEIGRFNNGFRP
jgi:hypothetical protein